MELKIIKKKKKHSRKKKEKKEGKINEGGAMSSYQQRRISEQTYKFSKCIFFPIFLCLLLDLEWIFPFFLVQEGKSWKEKERKVELGKKAENQYGKMIRKRKHKLRVCVCVCVWVWDFSSSYFYSANLEGFMVRNRKLYIAQENEKKENEKQNEGIFLATATART